VLERAEVEVMEVEGLVCWCVVIVGSSVGEHMWVSFLLMS